MLSMTIRYIHFIQLSKETNDPSLYYKVINRLKSISSTGKAFNVCELFEGQEEAVAAKKNADFFTSISDKFTGLKNDDISDVARRSGCIRLSTTQGESRIRQCKKPKGLLSGDIFPS